MIYLKNEDLNEIIKEGNYLIDFYAEWCGPCKMLEPILEKIKEKINIIKINVDNHRTLAQEYKVMSIPTIMFFKDGDKKTELIGFQNIETLEEIVNNL